MKLLNCLTLIFFLVTSYSNAQDANCSFKDVLRETIIEDISYEIIKNDTVNFENTLRYNKNKFIGYIGDDKKRIEFYATEILRDEYDNSCYLVKGYTVVSNKITRSFEGEFRLNASFLFSEEIYGEDINEYGFSTFDFMLEEDEKLSATGIFKGQFLILWHIDEAGLRTYNNIFDGYDGDRNYQFLGTWKSFRKAMQKPIAWGYNRIPCSGDLDIGAGEFSPNPKYYSQGWREYKP